MIGQNIGGKRRDRVKQVVKCSMIVTGSAALVLSAASLLWPEEIFWLFTADNAVMAYAQPLMRVSCLIYMLSAAISPYDAVVSGTGNSFLGMAAGLLDGVFFHVRFVYVLDMGVIGFFMGDALARLGLLTVGGLYYYTGAWERNFRSQP